MPDCIDPTEIHERDLDIVWQNNPVAAATMRAGLFAKADELTILRATILNMHKLYEQQFKDLLNATLKARSFDMMTEGIEIKDGKRFVFRPPKPKEK